jgi:hypothetical protein
MNKLPPLFTIQSGFTLYLGLGPGIIRRAM